jgi:hypothetical protein
MYFHLSFRPERSEEPEPRPFGESRFRVSGSALARNDVPIDHSGANGSTS